MNEDELGEKNEVKMSENGLNNLGQLSKDYQNVYGPFLLKLPYYQKNEIGPLLILFLQIIFFYVIMDRYIYLNQDHFITK